MIDKIIYAFLNWLDRYSEWVDKMFIDKKKKK